jgi:NADH-quinone oxidoreductase subunit D
MATMTANIPVTSMPTEFIVSTLVAIESPRGELGCYLVSDGGPRPWRVHFRAPSFVALQGTALFMQDMLVADMIAILASLDPVMGEVDR